MKTTDSLLDEGIEKIKQGDRKGAIELWTQAIAIDETLVKAYTNRGTAKSELNDIDSALADFDKALELDANNADAYLGRANIFARQKNHNKAVMEFDKLIAIHPNDGTAYYNRGNSHMVIAMERMMSIQKMPPATLKQLPKMFHPRTLSERSTQNALADFNKAIELIPDLASAYSNRANIHMQMKNTKDALSDITKAIELEPDNANYYKNRGSLYVGMRQPEPALKDYEIALKLNPKMGEVWSLKGTMLHMLERNKEAIDAYNKALELEPQNLGNLMNRGIAYRHLGEHQKAITDLNNFASKAGKRIPPQFYRNRGNVHEALENKDQAVQDYDTYLKIGGGRMFKDQAEIEAKIKALKKPKWKIW